MDSTNNTDFYTEDNANAVTGETAGVPLNGDATNNRQEASNSDQVAITSDPLTLVPAPICNPDQAFTSWDGGLPANGTLMGTSTNLEGTQVTWTSSLTSGSFSTQPRPIYGETSSSLRVSHGGGISNLEMAFDVPTDNLTLQVFDLLENNERVRITGFNGATQILPQFISLDQGAEVGGANNNEIFDGNSDGLQAGARFTFPSPVDRVLFENLGTQSVVVYQLFNCQSDFGDAPESYNTLFSSDGPRHAVNNSISLGTTVDGDTNGFGDGIDDNADATDDTDDGVQLNGAALQGQNLTVGEAVSLDIETTGTGVLNAWFDWNGNSDFTDPGEQVAIDEDVSGGTLSVAVPNGATVGDTYARFRYSTDSGLAPTGLASDGEVEDYSISIVASSDNPDLPSDFCQTSPDIMFILDYSGSVDDTEQGQQRDAVLEMLDQMIAADITARVAIVAFDSNAATVIGYTAVNQSTRQTFVDRLQTNYVNAGGGATDWESGFRQAINISNATGITPDTVFFFADGLINNGGSADDEAQTFAQGGSHIYGIGIDVIDIGDMESITDGPDTLLFDTNANNVRSADYVDVNTYSELASAMANLFSALCPTDYSDAPLTGIAPDTSSTNAYGDAAHLIVSGLHLGGTAPDAEFNSLASADATADDTTGSIPDDEDDFIVPTLVAGSSSYSIPTGTITVTNSTGSDATLHAWIDFNKNGTFESPEHSSTTVVNGGVPGNLNWTGITVGSSGNTFARFRITTDNSVNQTTPDGGASDGEVEDYQFTITGAPEMLLVKRITAINGDRTSNPNDGTPLNQVIDDTSSIHAIDDNNAAWPANYLIGSLNSGTINPGDEIEYTLYFLNSGEIAISEVHICDRILGPQSILFDAYGSGEDIEYQLGTNPIQYLTYQDEGTNGRDRARFYPNSADAPDSCALKPLGIGIADNGTLKLNVTGSGNTSQADLTTLPTQADAPADDSYYGYLRFRTTVQE